MPLRNLLVAALVVGAYAPLLSVYFSKLWGLPHYQFFPFALFCSALLGWRDGCLRGDVSGSPSIRSQGLIAVAIAMLFGAVLLESPWLAYASLLTIGVGLGSQTTTSQAGTRWGPALLMALTVLRLPLNLDLWLIQQLQAVTARISSRILDAMGIVHLLTGNVVEVSDARLLVEEACSGINSLFSAGACTLFFVLWLKRRAIPASLLLLTMPVWVVAANIARVTCVAVLRSKYSFRADEGWAHDLLGMLVFVTAMALVISTDALIQLFAPASSETIRPQAAGEAPAKMIHPAYRWAVALLLVASMVQVPNSLAYYRAAAVQFHELSTPELGLDVLPDAYPLGKRSTFELARRTVRSRLGETSQIWNYASDRYQTTVSLDYPFLGWHEVTECFASQGWKPRSRSIVELHDPHDGSTTMLVVVPTIQPQDDKHGILMFALFDEQFAQVPPSVYEELDEFKSRVTRRLRNPFRIADVPLHQSLNRQLLVFVEGYLPLATSEVEAAQQFYLAARRGIRDALTVPPAEARP